MKALLEATYGNILEPALLSEIETSGSYKQVNAGEILIDIAETISAMPLLFNGAIKVMREDIQGDELLLYFIERGDSCAMTFSCWIGNGKSKIRAVTETSTELVMLPIEKMDPWMTTYASWRKFVLDSYHNRMLELLETVDTLAFQSMDHRILKYLKEKAMVIHDDVIKTTHRDVANDLHTSRVVVSRLLKKLEKAGKIKLGRNEIRLLEL